MTEDEGFKISIVVGAFWADLGTLAAKHLASLPEHLENELLMSMQDACSIYGTKYSEHMPAARLIEELKERSKFFSCNVAGCCGIPGKKPGHIPLAVMCPDCGYQLVEVASTGLVFCSNLEDLCGCEWASFKEASSCSKT
jgi:hypothetical protein